MVFDLSFVHLFSVERVFISFDQIIPSSLVKRLGVAADAGTICTTHHGKGY